MSVNASREAVVLCGALIKQCVQPRRKRVGVDRFRRGAGCFLFVLAQLMDAAHAARSGRCLRPLFFVVCFFLFSLLGFRAIDPCCRRHGGLDSVLPSVHVRPRSETQLPVCVDLRWVTSMFAGSSVVTAGCGAAV